MTPTKLWTSWNGTKTPVQLMEKKHLKAAYVRVREIIVANEHREYWEKRERMKFASDFAEAKSPISFEQAKQWQEIFEAEALNRNMILPVVTFATYEKSVTNRQDRKNYAKEYFDKIIK